MAEKTDNLALIRGAANLFRGGRGSIPAQRPQALVELDHTIEDILAHAAEDPDNAPSILADAADSLIGIADSRDPHLARALHSRAADLREMAEARHQQRIVDEPREPRESYTKDDFEEQEIEKARAHHEVTAEGGDDLDIKARSNQLASRRESKERDWFVPGSVNENTPLGRSVSIKWNPDNTDIVNNVAPSGTVVYWSGRKTEARAFTVDVGVQQLPTPGSNVSPRPYCVATIGGDGWKSSFSFDLLQGARFTAVGNYCDVLIAMGQPGTGFLESGVIVAGAQLGFFASPSVQPLTFTAYLDAIVLNTPSTPVRIPNKSKSFTVTSTDPFGTTTVEIFAVDGTTLIAKYSFANNTLQQPIVLPGNAVGGSIVVTPTALTPLTDNQCVIFNIAS